MFTLGLIVISLMLYPLLILAKILGFVDISWTLILSPIWISAAALTVFGVGTISFLFLLASVSK